MALSLAQFQILPVQEMKTILRTLNLPVIGSKPRLIERYGENLVSGRKHVIRDAEGSGSVFDGLQRITRDIHILLKQIHPELSISTPAQNYMVDRVKFLISLLLKNMPNLLEFVRARTLTSRVAQGSCRIVLPHPLDDQVVSYATITIARWATVGGEINDEREPESPDGSKIQGRRVLDKDKAGLRVRPTLLGKFFHRILSSENEELRYSKSFAIYLTAAIEFILTQILEQAGRIARLDQRVRIIPQHLDYAILNNPTLFVVFTTPVIDTFTPDIERLNRLKYGVESEWTAFQTRIARATLESGLERP